MVSTRIALQIGHFLHLPAGGRPSCQSNSEPRRGCGLHGTGHQGAGMLMMISPRTVTEPFEYFHESVTRSSSSCSNVSLVPPVLPEAMASSRSFLRGIEAVHDQQRLAACFLERYRRDLPTVATFFIGPDEARMRCGHREGIDRRTSMGVRGIRVVFEMRRCTCLRHERPCRTKAESDHTTLVPTTA